MNILFVLPSYEPAWVYGGIVRCTSTLCKGLVSIGNKVTVYTTNTSGSDLPLDVPLNQPVDLCGVKVYYFASSFNKKSNFYSYDLIAKLRKTVTQFDIVYCAGVWQWLVISVSSICSKTKIPLVIGTHGALGNQARQYRWWKKNIWRMLFYRRTLKQAQAIHLTTNTERRESWDWLEKRPSFIVPNPIDQTQFYPIQDSKSSFRQTHHIPAGAYVTITVGRPDWMKRVDILIQSLVANPNWCLVVVGNDEEERALKWKEMAEELDLKDRVIWTGYLTGEDLLAAYSSADLFALISESENFGMVVVEAMLANLPILVSENVGVWSVLQNKDVGVSAPLDFSAISKVMGDFEQNSDLWQARAKNARFVAISEFSTTKVATLMQDSFADVISGHRSSHLDWA
jgi:glycosyltransferase involved in cell wall biosynthesis